MHLDLVIGRGCHVPLQRFIPVTLRKISRRAPARAGPPPVIERRGLRGLHAPQNWMEVRTCGWSMNMRPSAGRAACGSPSKGVLLYTRRPLHLSLREEEDPSRLVLAVALLKCASHRLVRRVSPQFRERRPEQPLSGAWAMSSSKRAWSFITAASLFSSAAIVASSGPAVWGGSAGPRKAARASYYARALFSVDGSR